MFFDLRPSPFDESTLARAKAYLNSKSTEEVVKLANAAARLDVAHQAYSAGNASKEEVEKKLEQCLGLLAEFEEPTFQGLVQEVEEGKFQWDCSSINADEQSKDLDPVFSLYDSGDQEQSKVLSSADWRWSEKLLYLFPCHIEAEALRLATADKEVDDKFEPPQGLPVVRRSSEPVDDPPVEPETALLSPSFEDFNPASKSERTGESTNEQLDEPLRRLLEARPEEPAQPALEDPIDLELEELLGGTSKATSGQALSQPQNRTRSGPREDPLSRLLEDSPDEAPKYDPEQINEEPQELVSVEKSRDPLEYLLAETPEEEPLQEPLQEPLVELVAEPSIQAKIEPLESHSPESAEPMPSEELIEEPLPQATDELLGGLLEGLQLEKSTPEPEVQAKESRREASQNLEIEPEPLGAPLAEPSISPLAEHVEKPMVEAGLDGVEFHQAIPVFRIFDQEKAREFYCDFLGFQVEWEHQTSEDAPIYIAIHRQGLAIHLTEHHGDCCPGSSVFVWMSELEKYYEELLSRQYSHFDSAMEVTPYAWFFEIMDPFGNRIRFSQPLA